MGPRTWQFDLKKEQTDTAVILTLTGRLGQASVHRLREAVGAPEPVGVVVDLAGLDYISGPGLQTLGEAGRRAAAAGRPFILCGLEGSVRVAFDLAGLLSVLTVETSRERGLARIANAPEG
jgi:anti-anti-sigma factor